MTGPPSIPDETNPEPVMIDRELRWMLERDGYDLHAIAEELVAQDYEYEQPGSDVRIALEEALGNVFELVKRGDGPPVMSCSTLIGRACYDGGSLFVWQLLPETLCAAILGRPLGDVVATEIPLIDERPIIDAVTCTQSYYGPNGERGWSSLRISSSSGRDQSDEERLIPFARTTRFVAYRSTAPEGAGVISPFPCNVGSAPGRDRSGSAHQTADI